MTSPAGIWRMLLVSVVFTAFGASQAEGQLSLVGGAAYTEALEGQWGIDARLGVDPPMLPIGFFGGADYFFADCSQDCSLWGWRLGAILHTATPGIQPYLTGAYLAREVERGGSAEKRIGVALGAGLRVRAGFRIQAEATWEFLGGGLDHWVVRIGFGL